MSNSLPSVDTPVPLEHTAEDTSKKELKTVAVTTAGTEVTELILQQENSQTQPSSDNSSHHSSPTITMVTNTPSHPSHTITYVH